MLFDSLNAVTAIENQADVVGKCNRAENIIFFLNLRSRLVQE